jgi:hypothetical protein
MHRLGKPYYPDPADITSYNPKITIKQLVQGGTMKLVDAGPVHYSADMITANGESGPTMTVILGTGPDMEKYCINADTTVKHVKFSVGVPLAAGLTILHGYIDIDRQIKPTISKFRSPRNADDGPPMLTNTPPSCRVARPTAQRPAQSAEPPSAPTATEGDGAARQSDRPAAPGPIPSLNLGVRSPSPITADSFDVTVECEPCFADGDCRPVATVTFVRRERNWYIGRIQIQLDETGNNRLSEFIRKAYTPIVMVKNASMDLLYGVTCK